MLVRCLNLFETSLCFTIKIEWKILQITIILIRKLFLNVRRLENMVLAGLILFYLVLLAPWCARVRCSGKIWVLTSSGKMWVLTSAHWALLWVLCVTVDDYSLRRGLPLLLVLCFLSSWSPLNKTTGGPSCGESIAMGPASKNHC